MPTTHLEKAVSKVLGSAKKAKGAIYGLSGVFKTMMKEHGEVTALLLKAKASSDPETRSRLWATIRKELLSHEQAETAVVYPIYEAHSETSQYAIQHHTEATALISLIERIEATNVYDPAWGTHLEQLIQLIRRHVQDEEAFIFPAGQRAFGDRAAELDTLYRDKRNALMLEL